MADETPVETVQDRVEALFEEPTEEPVAEPVDEPTEEPTEESEEEVTEEVEEPTEPETVDVEFQGKLYEVPPELKDALLREGDYTQKTQDVATQRKELEIQSENLKRVNSQYEFAMQVQDDVLKAHQLDQQIDQARAYMRENIDGMSHTDLEKIRMAIDETRSERDKLINGINAKNTQFQQAHEQTLKELVDKSTEVLRQKIPDWGDSHETQIKEYALSLGIPEQAYNSVVDPVEKLILHKAMQFDALKAGKAAAVEKVVSTPSIKAKSRNPMSKDTGRKLNLRKKLKDPKRSDKAKFKDIQNEMGERFG